VFVFVLVFTLVLPQRGNNNVWGAVLRDAGSGTVLMFR